MTNKYLPNILIVDDHEDSLTYLEILMRTHNVNIIKSFSGKEALSKIIGIKIALAIIDVQMPLMNGFELALLIKKQQKSQFIPIIYLTAYYKETENVRKGYETGAVDYLIKPIDKTIILSKINVFLELDRNKYQILNDKFNLEKIIQEYELTKQTLTFSEEKYRTMIENSNDLIWMLDENGKFSFFNKQVEKTTAYKFKDCEGKSIFQIVTKKDFPLIKEVLSKNQNGEKQNYQLRIKIKNKRSIMLKINMAPIVKDNLIKGSVSFAQDISKLINTEKKIVKSNRDLLKLSVYVEELRENERKKIALDLHDDLGQKLTALNIDFAWLKKKQPKGNIKFSEKLVSMEFLLKESIESVRKIAFDLRPPIIDDLGLMSAIEWQANEFEKHTEISCNTDLLSEDIYLTTELSINIFRIVQEALTNVSKHSQASKVIIRITTKDNILKLKIVDNGIGLKKNQRPNSNSFGLLGMSERTKLCGGMMKISGKNKIGTELIIKLPLSKKIQAK